jgi:hypothetical protein
VAAAFRVVKGALDLTSSLLNRLATRYPDFVAVALLAKQTRCEASALQGHLVLLSRMGLIDIRDSEADLVNSACLTSEGLRMVGVPRVRQRREAMRRKP